MSEDSNLQLPLLKLFDRLRKAGLPLGIDEYKLALRALQSGYGIQDYEALARLCRTLWVKSEEDKLLFNYHFEQVMDEESQSFAEPEPILTLPKVEPQKKKQLIKLPRLSPTRRIVWGGTLLLIAGVGLWLVRPQSKKCPYFTSVSPIIPVRVNQEYSYQVKACKANENDRLKITALKNPPWLKLKDGGDGTATLKGKPVSQTFENIQVKLQVTDASGSIKDTQSFKINVLSEDSPDIQQLIYLAIAGVVAFLVWSGGYFIARYWLERIAKSRVKEITPSPESTSTPTPSPKEQKAQPEDVVQVVRAVRQTTRIETGEYFPITRRQMKQSWRYLRRFVRDGPATELDIEATVKQFVRQGVLLQTVLMPRRVNRAQLLLLMDRDGSMIPFHELSRRLAETAAQGGRLAKADVYYFHNCSDKYIYQDPSCCEAKLLTDILANYSNSAGVLIFSDAGAARGGCNQERIDLTQQFLQQLKQRVRYIAWLNPMPKSRWDSTSADEIASLVPMFELSRQGLQGAISVLRGKFTPYRL